MMRSIGVALAAACVAMSIGIAAFAQAGEKQITVGFAQTGSESGWRNANTISVKDEAKKRNINLKFVDANSKVDNQRKALSDFIAQRVDIIILEPLEVGGWDSVLKEAKEAGIPVIIGDRNVSS